LEAARSAAASDYIEHGKTSWAGKDDTLREPALGWYVGWIERGGRRWFFALNIDLPKDIDDAAKRVPLAHALLTRTGALPAATQ